MTILEVLKKHTADSGFINVREIFLDGGMTVKPLDVWGGIFLSSDSKKIAWIQLTNFNQSEAYNSKFICDKDREFSTFPCIRVYDTDRIQHIDFVIYQKYDKVEVGEFAETPNLVKHFISFINKPTSGIPIIDMKYYRENVEQFKDLASFTGDYGERISEHGTHVETRNVIRGIDLGDGTVLPAYSETTTNIPHMELFSVKYNRMRQAAGIIGQIIN